MTSYNKSATLHLFNERAAIVTVARKLPLRLQMNPSAHMENKTMNKPTELQSNNTCLIIFTSIDYGMAESDMIRNKQCSSTDEFQEAFPSEITIALTPEECRNMTNAIDKGTIATYAFELIHDEILLMPRAAHVEIPSVAFSQHISFEADYIQMGTLIRFLRGYIRLGEMMNLLASQGLDISRKFESTKWHLKATTDRVPPPPPYRAGARSR